MNEISKTLTFVALAALVVLAAVFTRPVVNDEPKAEDFRGQPLYPNFTDPMAVASLEIVKFDEENATVQKFVVAEVDVAGQNRWVIPSHYNYPADAKDQVADAAGGLMGLRIIEMVGDDKSDQRVYGVIAPDPVTLRVGDSGVGKQVVMRSENGKELISLVIGKEADQPGLRYVRKTGEDPIYAVRLDPSKLSTDFDDWIERNPLEIQPWDMRRLWFRNYYVDELNGQLVQQGNMRIAYNDAGDPAWELVEDQRYERDPQNPEQSIFVPVKLADDEELNVAKLNELKNELDNLKIVDVNPKPAGISADLKADAGFKADQKTYMQLRSKGFFLAPTEDGGPMELFSNEGELRITMKDGVEYVLRFGEIAVGSTATSEKDGQKDKADNGVNRYLFVMAEFNPDIIPKPQFEPLPKIGQTPEDKPNAEEKPASEETAESASAAAADKTDKPQESEEEKAGEQLKIERERIERENQRKQDEYDRLVEEGKKRVAELNARFADWYYIISNDVFQKIHLGRDELIKKKETTPAEGEHAGHAHSDAHDAAAFPDEVLDKLNPKPTAEEEPDEAQ